MSSSSKLPLIFYHFWEFMGGWGTTGICGERAIESWHGFPTRTRLCFRLKRPCCSVGSCWCR